MLNKLSPGITSTQSETDAATGVDAKPVACRRRSSELHLNPRSDSLEVEGQNDLLVYRARCCNPIRGEEIIGYVTRGKGVAVHARQLSECAKSSLRSGPPNRCGVGERRG